MCTHREIAQNCCVILQIQLLQKILSRASTWQEQRMVGNMVVVAVVVIGSVDEPSTYLMYVFPPSHSDAQLHFLICPKGNWKQQEIVNLGCHVIILVRTGMMWKWGFRGRHCFRTRGSSNLLWNWRDMEGFVNWSIRSSTMALKYIVVM